MDYEDEASLGWRWVKLRAAVQEYLAHIDSDEYNVDTDARMDADRSLNRLRKIFNETNGGW